MSHFDFDPGKLIADYVLVPNLDENVAFSL